MAQLIQFVFILGMSASNSEGDTTCLTFVASLASPHQSFASISSVNETYGKIPRKDWLRGLIALYPELLDLQLKVDSSPERRNKKPHSDAASEVLFGEGAYHDGDYSEFDATINFIELLLKAKRRDYEGFVGTQPEAIRLKRESFDILSDFVNRLTPTSEDLDAAIVGAVLHDLGKIKMFGDLVSSLKKEILSDHDEILFHAISSIPVLTRSNARLSKVRGDLNIASFDTGGFELPQFVQGENLAFHCQKLSTMSLAAFDWMTLRSIFDVAGAAGGQSPLHSAVMLEPVFQVYWNAYLFVREKIEKGISGQQIYREYIKYRGEQLGFDMTQPIGFAQTRIALWNRISKRGADTELLEKAFDSLPAGSKKILVDELNADGIDKPAIFLYYSPGFGIGLLKSEFYKGKRQAALEEELRFIFRLFLQSKAQRDSEEAKVFTVNLNESAVIAEKNPERLSLDQMTLEKTSQVNAVPKFTPYPELRTEGLSSLSSLTEIPGKNIVVFTVGGGSDILRAEEMGWLLEAAGKKVLAQASIVRWEAASAKLTPDPKTRWVLENHGGKIFNEVYRITSETTSPTASSQTNPYARFFEAAAARGKFPTYRIHLSDGFNLAQQAQAVIEQLSEKPDLILFLDSGGDSAQSASSPYASGTEQDTKVLQLLQPLQTWNPAAVLKTVIVSPGVDAPEGIANKLAARGALYYRIPESDRARILKERAGLEAPFSRMSDAWFASLQGAHGWIITGLPYEAINHPNGKGNPIVYVHAATPGILFLDFAEHLKMIWASQVHMPAHPGQSIAWVLPEELATTVINYGNEDRRAANQKLYELRNETSQVLGNSWILAPSLKSIKDGEHIVGVYSSWRGPGQSVEVFEGVSIGEQNISSPDERPFFATLIQTRDGRRIQLTTSERATLFQRVP